MKRIITALLAFSLSVAAQYQAGERTTFKSIKPVFRKIEFAAATRDTCTLWVPWPTDNWDVSIALIDTTQPTAAAPQYSNEMLATGDVYLSVIPDSVTAQESDSLSAYIVPIAFNKVKGQWYAASNDTTWLVLDTPGVYTDTEADWLDWTHGAMYGVQLSNELWSSGGFLIGFVNKVETGDTELYVGLFFVR